MPVRGPWCGRVCAWVIKYDEWRGDTPFRGGKGDRISLRLSVRLTLLVVLTRLPEIVAVAEITSSWSPIGNPTECEINARHTSALVFNDESIDKFYHYRKHNSSLLKRQI